MKVTAQKRDLFVVADVVGHADMVMRGAGAVVGGSIMIRLGRENGAGNATAILMAMRTGVGLFLAGMRHEWIGMAKCLVPQEW